MLPDSPFLGGFRPPPTHGSNRRVDALDPVQESDDPADPERTYEVDLRGEYPQPAGIDPSAAEVADVDTASNEHEAHDPAGNEYRSAYGLADVRFESEAADTLTEQARLATLLAQGIRDPNVLADTLFFTQYPELKGVRLRAGQDSLMAEWRRIRNEVVRPALVKIPSDAMAPAGDPTRVLLYDGKTPARGTVETRRSFPTSPPITGDPTHPNRTLYENVINQFAVDVNPRYRQKQVDGKVVSTYCNIFCWDVTRAMGVEVPHWVDERGNPARVGNGNELNANATNEWLRHHGARFGWRRLDSPEDAMAMATGGRCTLASLRKPGGIGHLAIIRPGELTEEGLPMAQAGRVNANQTRSRRVFRRGSPVELWSHRT